MFTKIIRKVLPLAIFLYLLLIGSLVVAQNTDTGGRSLHDLDKAVAVLESKEQDRRDNNTLLWTLIGGSVLNLLVTSYIARGQKKSE